MNSSKPIHNKLEEILFMCSLLPCSTRPTRPGTACFGRLEGRTATLSTTDDLEDPPHVRSQEWQCWNGSWPNLKFYFTHEWTSKRWRMQTRNNWVNEWLLFQKKKKQAWELSLFLKIEKNGTNCSGMPEPHKFIVRKLSNNQDKRRYYPKIKKALTH
jgi:hypothetical protein